jgi:hypothetical protein
MRNFFLIPLIGIILCGAILFSSCASTTLMQSIPTGAKLYMDGEPVGTTPYAHTDTKIVGSTTPFRMVLDGYQDYNGMLKRNEEANVGAIIGGVFLLFPFLWTMDYKPSHTYELIPVNK